MALETRVDELLKLDDFYPDAAASFQPSVRSAAGTSRTFTERLRPACLAGRSSTQQSHIRHRSDRLLRVLRGLSRNSHSDLSDSRTSRIDSQMSGNSPGSMTSDRELYVDLKMHARESSTRGSDSMMNSLNSFISCLFANGRQFLRLRRH